MSIIAVEGLPIRISLFQVGRMLSKCVQGQFEPLNFMTIDRVPFKTCYLQLSDKLDPLAVIERINNIPHGKKRTVLNAFIPDTIPDMLPIPVKLQKAIGTTKGIESTSHLLSVAHTEIMTELQYKYTGLYSLSAKGSHALLEAIGMTVYDRLKQLQASGDEEASNPFLLTGRYRKTHPHFGDFQLILGTLHRLEDAAGAPRTQLQETELTVTPKDTSVIDSLPYSKAQEAVTKYTDNILKKLEQHIASYELSSEGTLVVEGTGAEEAARRKVRAQLAKMMPYLPTLMKQVVTNHFAEDHQKTRYHKMRMYGEPYLPGKELMLPLMRRHAAQRAARWKAMYNLLVFEVPLEHYSRLMALDGTNLGGSKIIIRSSNAKIYRVALSKRALAAADMDDDEEMEH